MADHGSNIDFCTLGMFIIGMLWILDADAAVH